MAVLKSPNGDEMTLLATLYPAYSAVDFDFETAYTSPKRLVITFDQAKEWAENEITEGRPIAEWEYEETHEGPRRIGRWFLECNEYGTSEEWFLFVEDVPFFSYKELVK